MLKKESQNLRTTSLDTLINQQIFKTRKLRKNKKDGILNSKIIGVI
jgi:hypothetical protein